MNETDIAARFIFLARAADTVSWFLYGHKKKTAHILAALHNRSLKRQKEQ